MPNNIFLEFCLTAALSILTHVLWFVLQNCSRLLSFQYQEFNHFERLRRISSPWREIHTGRKVQMQETVANRCKKKKGSKKKSRIYYPLQCPFNWSLISNIICVLKEYSVFSGIPKTRGFVYCTMTPDTCTCPGAFGEYWFAQTWLLNSSALLYPLLNYLMTSHF